MTLWQHYHTPSTVLDALGLLRHYGDQAQIIAGGTDLIIDMQNGSHAPVTALVDVTHIDSLSTIHTESDTDDGKEWVDRAQPGDPAAWRGAGGELQRRRRATGAQCRHYRR
jgi:hypothetical protein